MKVIRPKIIKCMYVSDFVFQDSTQAPANRTMPPCGWPTMTVEDDSNTPIQAPVEPPTIETGEIKLLQASAMNCNSTAPAIQGCGGGAYPQRTKSVMLLSREEVSEAGSPDATSDAWG